mgnify:CR=1 FL=1
MVNQKNKSCVGCYLENENKCYWFVKRNNERLAKDIPSDIFKNGCSKYELNIGNIESSELMSYIIDIFDGEIIGDKFKPIKKKAYYSKQRKKRVYKTKHNYTERKDW